MRWTTPFFTKPSRTWRGAGDLAAGGRGSGDRCRAGRAGWNWCGGGNGGAAAHASVHGVVGELIGFFVAASEGVLDLKFLELVGATAGFFPEWAEVGAVDFVFALHLLDHEFRVGHDAQAGVLVFEAPGEDAEQG